MTKGVISANLGLAQYGVRLEYETGALDAEIDLLRQRLVELTQYILDAKVGVIEIDNQLQAFLDEVDDIIESYGGKVPDDASEMIEILKSANRFAALKQSQQFKVDRLVAKKLGIAARKTMLENAKLTVLSNSLTESVMYCADYTDDLETGAEVGVVVVPGEFSEASLTVFPQDLDLSGYDRERDGQLAPPLSMTPEATFYNWAMLPGWQRWMPTYRHGRITAFSSGDFCTVVLDEAVSSEANPDGVHYTANLAESTSTELENVPIRYMDCNSAAFALNDHVIVRFDGVDKSTAGAANWSNPRVIGFVTNPQQCPTPPEPPAEPERRNLIEYDLLFEKEVTDNIYTSELNAGAPIDNDTHAGWTESFSGETTATLWEIGEGGPSVTFTASGSGSVSDTVVYSAPDTYTRVTSETRTVTVVGNYSNIGNVTVYSLNYSRAYDVDTLAGISDRDVTINLTTRFPIWICASGNSYMEQVTTLSGSFSWEDGDPSLQSGGTVTKTFNVYHAGVRVVSDESSFGFSVTESFPAGAAFSQYADYGDTLYVDCIKRVAAGLIETDAIDGCDNTDTDDYDSPLNEAIQTLGGPITLHNYIGQHSESINTASS